jgi:hypothetical protein
MPPDPAEPFYAAIRAAPDDDLPRPRERFPNVRF